MKNTDKRKQGKIEEEDIDKILQPKNVQEQNSRAFGLMDNFGPVLNKWQNKSETFNPTKAGKNRVNESLDPSITSGIQSFPSEALERHTRLKPHVSDEFLSRLFRGSNIFTENDKQDGSFYLISSPAILGHS